MQLCDHVRLVSGTSGGVMMDIESGRCYAFNQTASRGLSLLARGVSVHDAAITLAEEFDESAEVIERDLESWLCALENNGLVHRR
jgi:hypothetical protein